MGMAMLHLQYSLLQLVPATHQHNGCVCRLVLAQNKKDLLTNWWNEGKLEASEKLGDMVSAAGDKDMALKIYQLCGASGKVRCSASSRD